MKHIFKTMAFLLAIVLFAGCHDITTEGFTKITYYCNLALNGDAVVFVPLGSTYTESGWKADLNGEDISDQVVVTGSVNVNNTGIYNLVYSAVNEDGFAKTAARQIIVFDPTPSAIGSGVYDISPNSNRNGTTIYGGAFTILIYQTSPGKFYVSDLFGGYYEQRAGYGSSYAMVGDIALASDNTITLLDSSVAGWNDGLDGLVNGSCDPDTKTVQWTAQYAGTYNFNVIATEQ